MTQAVPRPAWPHRAVHVAARRLAFLRHRARRGCVTVDGVPIAWAENGSPDAPPVLLLHGLRGEITAMLPVATALASRGFRAISIDLPGHGDSPELGRRLTIPVAAQLLRGVVSGLGLKRPHLLGHSMGGWISAWACLEEPRTFCSLSLIASAGFVFDAPPRELLLPTTTENARKMLPRLFAHPPRLPAIALYFSSRRKVAADYELLESALSGEFLLESRLAGLAVPALVISAEEDRLIPPSTGREMAAMLPGNRYLELPGAGHMLIWEKTEDLADAVSAFLRMC